MVGGRETGGGTSSGVLGRAPGQGVRVNQNVGGTCPPVPPIIAAPASDTLTRIKLQHTLRLSSKPNLVQSGDVLEAIDETNICTGSSVESSGGVKTASWR